MKRVFLTSFKIDFLTKTKFLMRKLLTLSLLVALISINVFGQNKPVKLAAADKAHAVAAKSIYSKIQSRADTTLFANFLPCDTFIFVLQFRRKKADR